MGLFSKQFANVVEWEEFRDDLLLWKWTNREIKKGSRLLIKPGQDAIFLYNGKVEGVFRQEGSFDIESDIVPFLSTLKGFKFGFNSGLRAEVVFVNTKEVTVKWGTKNPINIPAQGLPGGMPVRAFGTFSCRVADEMILIDTVAGVKNEFGISDVKERVISQLDQLLMKWIASEGKDLFNLQANASEISAGIRSDLDMELHKIGIAVTAFSISSVTYPEEIQKMAEKAASQSMVGDMNTYQQVAMADALANGTGSAGSMAGNMVGMSVGMAMGTQMASQLQQAIAGSPAPTKRSSAPQDDDADDPAAERSSGPKFCPNCGTKNTGTRFCPNCGQKLT